MRFLSRWSWAAGASRSRPDEAQGADGQVESILVARGLGRS
jgi:hypothetical protein